MSRLKIVALVLVLTVTAAMVVKHRSRAREWNPTDQRPATMDPDYTDVTVPPNIAPLNFRISVPGQGFEVQLLDDNQQGIRLRQRSPLVRWPARQWRQLLASHRGQTLHLAVAVQESERRWRSYQPAAIRVAEQPIDPYLYYRSIRPLHNTWGGMEIRQRDLTSFDERVVVSAWQYENGCANCHSMAAGKANRMVIGVRSEVYGSGTVLVIDGQAIKLQNKVGYPAWHPDGQLLVFTLNKVRQWFHPAAEETREVLDLKAGLGFWRLGSEAIETIPAFSSPDRLLTFPTWSPDGTYLYYCSGPLLWDDFETVPPEKADQVRFDLMRIPYAACDGTWGEPELVLSAEAAGGSVTEPKVRPDGVVIVTICDYGAFPIHRLEADLYAVRPNLAPATGWSLAKLPINSETAESWHSLSQDGNWMIFSSKRRDGAHARPYLTWLGQACAEDPPAAGTKPFLLPVEDPAIWDRLMESVNSPELALEPETVNARVLGEAIRSGAGIELAMPEVFAPEERKPGQDDWKQR